MYDSNPDGPWQLIVDARGTVKLVSPEGSDNSQLINQDQDEQPHPYNPKPIDNNYALPSLANWMGMYRQLIRNVFAGEEAYPTISVVSRLENEKLHIEEKAEELVKKVTWLAHYGKIPAPRIRGSKRDFETFVFARSVGEGFIEASHFWQNSDSIPFKDIDLYRLPNQDYLKPKTGEVVLRHLMAVDGDETKVICVVPVVYSTHPFDDRWHGFASYVAFDLSVADATVFTSQALATPNFVTIFLAKLLDDPQQNNNLVMTTKVITAIKPGLKTISCVVPPNPSNGDTASHYIGDFVTSASPADSSKPNFSEKPSIVLHTAEFQKYQSIPDDVVNKLKSASNLKKLELAMEQIGENKFRHVDEQWQKLTQLKRQIFSLFDKSSVLVYPESSVQTIIDQSDFVYKEICRSGLLDLAKALWGLRKNNPTLTEIRDSIYSLSELTDQVVPGYGNGVSTKNLLVLVDTIVSSSGEELISLLATTETTFQIFKKSPFDLFVKLFAALYFDSKTDKRAKRKMFLDINADQPVARSFRNTLATVDARFVLEDKRGNKIVQVRSN